MNEAITKSSETEKEWVIRKLVEYNKQFVTVEDDEHRILLNFNIKNGSDIVAGVNAELIAKGALFISILWVDEEHRGNEYGSMLLDHVENKARSYGAKLVYLDTVDFQAPGFYRKRGYEEFGMLENSPVSGHKKFFMKKTL